MSEENKNNKTEINEIEEIVNLNVNGDQKIDVLADGTEIIRDEFDEEELVEKEEISLDDLRKLVLFTTRNKNITDEELEELKQNDSELERLIRISHIKSKHLTYAPKKNFNAAYRKERQRKNRQARKSRKINRV